MSTDDIDGWRTTHTGARYPSELVCDVRTGAGHMVHLRPIRPDDGCRLRQFHEHLSAHSVYLRYFFTHPRLSPEEVDRFTHVDYVDRLALIGEDRAHIIAVGRYERLPGTSQAEVAFIVADEAQHQGIGSLLLARLAQAAVANGITTFVAQTLAENRGMINVFLNSGFPVTSHSEYGTVDVSFPIDGSVGRPGADDATTAATEDQAASPVHARDRGPETVGHDVDRFPSVAASPCLWS
jgi:GNAT superfamily N-acetyltransferase